MPRHARVVVAGLPHHVTQRGNRQAAVFSTRASRLHYLDLLQLACGKHGMTISAYCLMPNHVHLVAIPSTRDALALALRSAHAQYAQWTNLTHGLAGHLWQGRFYSCPLDEPHFWAALRYVEQNPVRAGLVRAAEDYEWSSARSHCGLSARPLVVSPLPDGVAPEVWREHLAVPATESMLVRMRDRTARGLPCGDDEFVSRVSEAAGLALARPNWD